MKKFFYILGLVLLTSLLFACKKQEENQNTNTESTENTDNNDPKNEEERDSQQEENDTEQEFTVKDYYPVKADTEYIYEGQGNEYASYNIFTDYIDGNRFQLRSNNGGSEMIKVLEYQDGQLVVLLAKGEVYYRENYTKVTATNPEILLKEPLVKGTEWTLPDNRQRYISDVDVEVNTPSGDYKALVVATENEDDIIYDYYAPGVGLVKSVFVSGEYEVSSTLSKIKENVPFTQFANFYYPDVNSDKIYYVPRNLEFYTNDITKSVFEKTYKEFSESSFGKVLGPNVKIKSLYLNQDNMVYVDFSNELVSEMNAGAGYESMILRSITNTIGNYYSAQKVYITIEGKPYSSGHIVMKKGEAFEVNLEDTIELKP